MNEFKAKYEDKNAKEYTQDFAKILQGDTTNLSWEDLYWISKLLYVYGSSNDEDSLDEEILIDAIRESFAEGLSVQENHENFLDASIILSRLYFKYGKYELAINYLMYLVDLLENVPEWIHLFYAYAQVLSQDHYEYLKVQPKHFFARLENVTSQRGQEKRTDILVEFAQKLLSEKNVLSETNLNGKKSDSSKEASNEIEKINATLEIIKEKSKSYGIGDLIEGIINPVPDYEQILEEKDSKIEELSKQISELQKELQELNQNNSESAVSKNEQDYSILIDELKEENSSLRTELEYYKSQTASLQKKNEQLLVQLQNAINSQPVSDNSSEEKIADEEPFQNYTNGHELLTMYQRNQKILVIGAANKGNLEQRYKKRGFVDKDFDFILDYDEIANATARMNFSGYAAIICGAMPHSASGKEDESSLVVALEKNYKNVIRATTKNGKLKLSDTAFSNALEQAMRKLSILETPAA